MQLTLRGTLPKLEKEEQEQIDNLMRVYQSTKRYSFNRLLEERKLNELKKEVMAKFSLNARYSYAAINDAERIIKSQKELIKEEVYETKEKLKKSRKKLEKVKAPLKRKGICTRIDKLTTKLNRYEKHLKEGTIPKVIFGGKKNFMKLQKGKITKEEWKKLRSSAFYSVGGKIDGGNQNLRITYIEDNM
ncbi:MAG: transposase, partial [Candidatus Altiarchaeota archaeon]|nr:transposase [Candidatus Altiarchaeota archaeon]